MTKETKNIPLTEWLGLTKVPDFRKSRPLGAIFGVMLMLAILALIVLFFIALAAAFVVVFHSIDPPADGRSLPNLGVGALLTALLSAPFVIWRTMVAQWTVDHQREESWNDRLNLAVEKLEGSNDGKPYDLNSLNGNITRVSNAIQRINQLSSESPENCKYPAKSLAAFISENSKLFKPATEVKIPPRQPRQIVEAVTACFRISNLEAPEIGEYVAQIRDGYLDRTIFRNRTISNLVFYKCSFKKSSFVRCKIENCYFVKCDFSNVDLTQSEISRCNFLGSKFDADTKLEGVNFLNTAFQAGRFPKILREKIYDNRESIFSDAHMGCDPEDPKISHWSKEKLDDDHFKSEWLEWIENKKN